MSDVRELDPIDGRTARRDRNRDVVLDAVLELFSEDHLAPSAQDVADRSGVSLRSVYRYYDDMEELTRAAIARNVEKARPLFLIECLGEGELEGRIERIVDSRLGLYRAMAPTMRAAVHAARRSEPIRTQLAGARHRLLLQVQQMFEPELTVLATGERREVTAALDVLLGFESMDHLRRQRGLSVAESRRTLVRSVRSMLDGAGAA